MTISFTVPGIPVAKARARVIVRNGKAHAYTPDKTANHENNVRVFAYNAGVTPLEGPLSLSCLFVLPFPKSMSKKKRLTAYPTKRPDIDNYLKATLDAMNGIGFLDDAQIVVVAIGKVYGEPPCTQIRISKIAV